jgi:protein involved in polysaccharide export with SLBB domain
MTRMRRLQESIPFVSFTIVLALFLGLVAPFAPVPAFAAEPLEGGSAMPALPPGLTPEQAEAARALLESNPEARKALEAAMQKRAAEAEVEATKRDVIGGKGVFPEGAARGERSVELPYQWQTSTYVGGLFKNRLSKPERETMIHFGHDLFVPSYARTKLLENTPVSPGYVVGPGDEIVVRMWGRVEGTQRMVVDRDGKIFFPKFGSLYVAGKTFEEVKSFLKAKVSTIAEVRSDVTMGQMKGIRVSVVGEVTRPGWYNVSSLNTALQALAAAGRIKDIGSLRRIEILRGGKTAERIDLYDFLLRGDTRADIRLLQGDVILVPVVGRLVAVAGEVRRPAIYELKDEKSLLELIRMAGGFTPAAFKRRVQVERLEGNVARVVLDTDADELGKGRKPFDLADGDLVRVLPIVLADENAVYLEGNVMRGGRYELKPGMTVGSLFKDEKDFAPETYFDYALITRLVPPDMHKKVVPVNLREIVLERKAGADVALMPRDTLKVFKRSDFKEALKAFISGEVRLTRSEARKMLALDNQALAGRMPLELKGVEFRGPAARRAETGGPGFRPEAEYQGVEFQGVERQGTVTRQMEYQGTQFRRPDSKGTGYPGTDSRENDLRRQQYPGPEYQGPDSRGTGYQGPDSRGTEYQGPDSRRPDSQETDLRGQGYPAREYPEKEYREADFRRSDARERDLRAGEPRGVEFRREEPREPAFRPDREGLTFEIQAGTRVADLVKMAGGLTRLASLDRAEILRVDDQRTFHTIYFNLGKAMAGDPEENQLLENEDRVRIHSLREKTYRKTVSVSGDVNLPGEFVLTEGMKLSDLLFKAGGFQESAYTKEAELVRRDVSPQGDLVTTQTVVVYPERVLGGEAVADLTLREYDYLYVRQIPDWGEKIQVTLAGEFRFPGIYAARKGERLSSVIERAGGYTKDAYLNAGVFTRVSTRKTQQEAIDRLIEELEISISEKGQEVSAALDKEDVESNKQLMEARRSLVSQLRKVRAKGRVIVHLGDPETMKGKAEDVILEDGDRLQVPQKLNVVNVVGRVYNPTGVVYDPANDSVQYYLETVGGPTPNADKDNIFLLKADGSVVSRGNADKGFFSGGFMESKVKPGDSVVVPEKLVQIRTMKDVKDITQILFQIAVTTGVVIALF